MISYFRPRIGHKIQLNLTPDEAYKLLAELDAFESADRSTTLKAIRLLELALASPVSSPQYATKRYGK